jgi:hypothetical protein
MNIKEKLLLLIKGSSNGSSEPKVKKVREKKITRLHLILVGLLIITALVVGIVIKIKIDTKDNIYFEYEKELVNSANIYYDLKEYDIKDGSTERIDAQKLIDANLVNIDSKLTTKCKGYVESVSEKDYNEGGYKVTRKAYIKCGNKYKTLNYVSY